MMRFLLSFALVCAVALGSVQMAMARGQPAPVGSIVICAGHGLMTVLVDANGQPTGTVRICPDCALHMFDTVTASTDAAQCMPHWSIATPNPIICIAADQTPLQTSARGPPRLI